MKAFGPLAEYLFFWFPDKAEQVMVLQHQFFKFKFSPFARCASLHKTSFKGYFHVCHEIMLKFFA